MNCVLLEDCFCALQQNRKGFLTLPLDAAQALSFRFLEFCVFVAASTHCFPDVTIDKSLRKLAELEYSASEIVIGNGANDLRPEWLVQDFQAVCRLCVSCRQISPAAFFIDLPTDDPHYLPKFNLCLKLSKTLGVVTIVVKASPVGTPYNEEFERLSKLVQLAARYGAIVSLLTEKEAVSGSIDSLTSLCKGIEGLRVALDPSHFIYGYNTPVDYEPIVSKASHLRLRDTTEKSFQVKIGQGVLEYKKLVDQLNRCGYTKALCVDLEHLPDVDPDSELRKMRLLVESLL